ncbi:hypothetical protein NBRGN_013_00050 [Nocardia brasiliensis NBRC 14402]|nr:hypothetical protein NBRGN_013_00050 [Nocardia brasiliensis NBRC 14402]
MCLVASVESELVAGSNPGDVQFAHSHTGFDLLGLMRQAVLGPQAELHVVLAQPFADLLQILVATAVAVVDQHPAVGHLVLGVALGDGDRVEGVPLAPVRVVQVAVRVAHLQSVDRRQEGPPDQSGVGGDHPFRALADDIDRIESPLVVRGPHGIAEGVAAGCESVAQHAVFVAGQVERLRIRCAAVVPVVVGEDLDRLIPVAESPVLLAAAEELFLLSATEALRGGVALPGQRRLLGPDLRGVGAVVQRETQRMLVRAQRDLAGRQGPIVAFVFAFRDRGWGLARQDDLVAGRIGEFPVGRQLHAHGAGLRETHPHRGGAGFHSGGGAVVGDAADVRQLPGVRVRQGVRHDDQTARSDQ